MGLPIGLYFILKENIQFYLLNYFLISIATACISVFIIKFLIKKKFINVFYLTILFMVSVFLFGLPLSKLLNKNEDFVTFYCSLTYNYM